jgi:hypothetical protein
MEGNGAVAYLKGLSRKENEENHKKVTRDTEFTSQDSSLSHLEHYSEALPLYEILSVS